MRLRLIVNPSAGRGRAHREIDRAVKLLLEKGAEVDVIESRGREDLVRLGAEAGRDGFDRVVVCGGDGSVNLVLRELDLERTVLGIIPLGSGDDFAKAAGIPRKLEDACETIVNGRVREVDVALANGIRYVGVAGFGFDAEVNRFANEKVRRLRGSMIYLWAIMNILPRFRPFRVFVEVDGTMSEQEMMFAVVSNSGSYGAGIRIAPTSIIDDGLLDMVVVHRCSKADLLRTLPLAYVGAHLKRPYVAVTRGTDFRFETEEPMSVFGDGEPLTTTPLTVALSPVRLRVLVPAAAK